MVLLSGEKLKGEQQQQVCPSSDRERELQSPGQERPAAEGEEDDGDDEGEEDENAEDEGEEDYEEYEDFSELPDTCSIASDDSFYPPGGDDDGGETWSLGESESESPEPLTVFRACCTNNAVLLKALIRQGPEEEEVCEADRNRRNGLIVACYQGFVDIVIALAQCPHLDVNWQDNEGNTALITAAQAGHITITNYLLNYFPGVDIEKRNVFGYTALMKAAMQGRTECVRALMLAGANVHSTDPNRGMTSWEWACYTGRSESAMLMQKLMDSPRPEQFCDQYKPEWPKMKELLEKAAEPKSCFQRISDCLRTVCPGSPPCVGKRTLSVQEILRKQRVQEIRSQDRDHVSSYEKLFQNSKIMVVPKRKDRRASLQPLSFSASQASVVATRKASLLPLHLLRRSSVRPGFVIPKVRITKAPPSNFQPEPVRRKSSARNNMYLQIPKWRYKELREERKKAEEQEKRRAEEIQRQKHISLHQKKKT
uniref:Ankyrin repeat domain 33B n=1 Tax=Crocodylus porosus TaxID=8502 RepID=A0A7M4F913_CROPO